MSVSVPGTVEHFAGSLSDPVSAVPGTVSDVRDRVGGWVGIQNSKFKIALGVGGRNVLTFNVITW
jgi:hypothetical protein